MMSLSTPHIFKKGHRLELKSLRRGENPRYYFFTRESNIPAIISLGNNLNEISGRILIGLFRILSYFGISRDPTDDFSKNNSNWNKFFQILKEGDYVDNESQISEIRDIIDDNNLELKALSSKIDKLINQEIQLISCKIDKVDIHLKSISGK